MSDEKKKVPNALKEKISRALTGKKSREELLQEWRKCRSPKKRGELLRKIRAL